VSTGLQQRHAADGQRRQYARDIIEFVDAQRFEIVTERRFNGTFPAALHGQLRGEPRLLAEA